MMKTYWRSVDSPASCQDIVLQLNDYIDGVLPAHLCEEVERHLAECPDCRVVFDTLRKTIILYRTYGQEMLEIPTDVEERLFRCLHLDDYLTDRNA